MTAHADGYLVARNNSVASRAKSGPKNLPMIGPHAFRFQTQT